MGSHDFFQPFQANNGNENRLTRQTGLGLWRLDLANGLCYQCFYLLVCGPGKSAYLALHITLMVGTVSSRINARVRHPGLRSLVGF